VSPVEQEDCSNIVETDTFWLYVVRCRGWVWVSLVEQEDCGNIIETDVFWVYVVRCMRWLWVSPVDQGLLTRQKHRVYPELLIGFVLLDL
jgi:hypothetical protein